MVTSQTSAPAVEVSEKFRLAVIPMTSTDQVEVNSHDILAQLKSIESFKPDLVCFPENSLYLNLHPQIQPEHAVTLQNPVWNDLKSWAQEQNCFVHLGGVPLLEENKVFNASVLVDSAGNVKVIYRKIHLFDVDVAGKVVRESDSLCAGEEPTVLDIKGWRFGMTICYDLRFAEMFIHYHREKVDVILVPAAFLVATGRDHWQVLLRARAIETQAYIAAPAQVGIHKSLLNPQLPERQTWGESLIIGPWGEILAASSSFDEPISHNPLLVELDRDKIRKTRMQIPLLSHRRFKVQHSQNG